MRGLRFSPCLLKHCKAGAKKYGLRLCAVVCMAAIMLGVWSVVFTQAADAGGVPNYLAVSDSLLLSRPGISGLVHLDNINFKPNGTGKVKPVESGLQATFKRQRGTMTLNCNGNTSCESAGLNGRQLKIRQDMQIVIDVIGAGVVGQSQGVLFVRRANGKIRRVRFTTNISGAAACVGNTNTCGTLAVTMTGNSNLLGAAGQVIGQMNLDLNGTLLLTKAGKNRRTAKFSQLTGSGTLQLAP